MTRSYVFDDRFKRFRIFKDDDAPTFKSGVSPIHKHGYAEVHLIASGYVECTVENVYFKLDPGDALLVPSGAYHKVDSDDEERVHFSFQVEIPSDKPVKMHFSREFIEDLFDKLKKGGDGGLSTLSYICSELVGIQYYRSEPERDYRHAIADFFDKRHHEKIEIEDLSSELHLSKMHTQRLVKRYTGMTFGENVRKYRLKVAEHLMKNTDMTKEEIARYVGYSSYSGFWKAARRDKFD